MDQLHIASTRQRDMLDLKERQMSDNEERERQANLMIQANQQQLKGSKEEVTLYSVGQQNLDKSSNDNK